MTRVESLADLRPGDIMFGPIGGAAGVLVAAGQLMLGEGWSVGPLKVRHVGVVVEAARLLLGPPEATGPKLVQAMPSGAEEIEMTSATHWTDRHAYVRLPEDYPGQAADAAAIARAMVGTPYSFLSYAALAAWKFGLGTPRLEAWINRRQDEIKPYWPAEHCTPELMRQGLPCEAICSVLVDQAWSLAGKKVMEGVPHQCVTPGALAARLLLDTEGARWAFPRRTSPVL